MINVFNRYKTFVVLQFADIVTTLIFLRLGVSEGNPIVKYFMTLTNPLIGLILLKSAGLYAAYWVFHRGYKLRKINFFYTIVVVWNLVAIGIS